jgi:hypothetical protein
VVPVRPVVLGADVVGTLVTNDIVEGEAVIGALKVGWLVMGNAVSGEALEGTFVGIVLGARLEGEDESVKVEGTRLVGAFAGILVDPGTVGMIVIGELVGVTVVGETVDGLEVVGDCVAGE